MTSIAGSPPDGFLDLPGCADDLRDTSAARLTHRCPAAYRWRLPAGSAAVPAARARVAAAACDLDRATVEVVLLLTSEMVTTAVVGEHATGARLTLALSEDDLRVELEADFQAPTDASSRPADEPPVRLVLVNACATDWGSEPSAQSPSMTRSVWFRLSLKGRPAVPPAPRLRPAPGRVPAPRASVE
jgi:hypothetical protein